MLLKVKCQYCGKIVSIEVNPDELKRWKSGELIQRAMPSLNASQRELLLSNTCNDCWNRLMKEED